MDLLRIYILIYISSIEVEKSRRICVSVTMAGVCKSIDCVSFMCVVFVETYTPTLKKACMWVEREAFLVEMKGVFGEN